MKPKKVKVLIGISKFTELDFRVHYRDQTGSYRPALSSSSPILPCTTHHTACSAMGKSSKRATEAEAAPAPSSDAGDVTMDVAEVVEPKAKKVKKEDGEAKEVPKSAISAIAHPLAGKKLHKHVYKLVKKGSSGS